MRDARQLAAARDAAQGQGATVVEIAERLSALLDRSDLTFVVACEAAARNADLYASVLEAEYHLMCDKPVGASSEQCKRVMRAAKKHDRLSSVLYSTRFRPGMQEASELIHSDAIGRLYSIEMRLLATLATGCSMRASPAAASSPGSAATTSTCWIPSPRPR